MNAVKSINSTIDCMVKNNSFSGVLLLKRGKKELYLKAVGFANRSHKVLNTLKTRFSTASITKMFTSISVLQLIEKGKLSLDTKAVEFLSLKDTLIPKEVTIFHLLTHTSGIADYFDESENDIEDYADLWRGKPNYSMKNLSDFLPLFINKEPISKPGEKFHYSCAGYILLGLIIEKASRESYFNYVRRNIFERINMDSSDFLSLENVDMNVAEGYIPVRDFKKKVVGWKRNIYTVPSVGASDGGAFSTAYNLINFMQSLRSGDLLSDKMTKEMISPKVFDEEDSGYIWKYGYANWFILDKNSIIIRYGHTGEDPGVSCRVFYYPSYDIDVVILGNQSNCAGPLGWDIHDLIIEGKL